MIGITNKKGKKYDYLSSYDVEANLDLMSLCVEDVFSLIECENIIEISETIGYEKASLFDLDRNGKQFFYTDIRDSLRCIIDDTQFALTLEQRIQYFIPSEYKGKKYHSMNPRFRFLKYNDTFHHFIHIKMVVIQQIK